MVRNAARAWKPVTKIDRFSLCAVPLEFLANGMLMGVATGFVWKLHEQHYLITNWHVITGRNTQTGKLELSGAARFISGTV